MKVIFFPSKLLLIIVEKVLDIGNLKNEAVYVQGRYLVWKLLSAGIAFLISISTGALKMLVSYFTAGIAAC